MIELPITQERLAVVCPKRRGGDKIKWYDPSDPSFDHVAVREPEVVVVVDPDFVPTDANPGTNDKIAVMEQRYEQGLPLFHPDDNKNCAIKIGEAESKGTLQKVIPEEDDYDLDQSTIVSWWRGLCCGRAGCSVSCIRIAQMEASAGRQFCDRGGSSRRFKNGAWLAGQGS